MKSSRLFYQLQYFQTNVQVCGVTGNCRSLTDFARSADGRSSGSAEMSYQQFSTFVFMLSTTFYSHLNAAHYLVWDSMQTTSEGTRTFLDVAATRLTSAAFKNLVRWWTNTIIRLLGRLLREWMWFRICFLQTSWSTPCYRHNLTTRLQTLVHPNLVLRIHLGITWPNP